MKIKNIKNMLKRRKKKEYNTEDFLSTGSTLLNLACTGKTLYGFIKGKYYYIVGDSASGKTFLTLTCLAEASINPSFDKYRFIYDNSEDGALMNIEQFFGKQVAQRLEAPGENNTHSSTIEEFYYHVDDAVKKGQPFIYILDSMDGLSSESEIEKFEETKKAFIKGQTPSGSYGDGKAKKNSSGIRRLLAPIRDTDSILIIISQTRDNLGFGFEKKIRSGGHALRFYACLEIWFSIKGKIYKNINGKKRQLGIECLCQIKKNRITGKEKHIVIPIYHSFGIDDVGSCIDYLINESHWILKGSSIQAPEFDFVGTKEKLVKYIEEQNMEKGLKKIVSNVWNTIEDYCNMQRKKRYK